VTVTDLAWMNSQLALTDLRSTTPWITFGVRTAVVHKAIEGYLGRSENC
jgi:hypothetical protein